MKKIKLSAYPTIDRIRKGLISLYELGHFVLLLYLLSFNSGFFQVQLAPPGNVYLIPNSDFLICFVPLSSFTSLKIIMCGDTGCLENNNGHLENILKCVEIMYV